MTLYLDTSSLVKLYVIEPGSEAVSVLVRQANVVATSVLAYAEMRAALARLRREKALTPAAFAQAKREFETEWPTYFAVEVTDRLCREAGALAERYGLRGVDSVHLASYVEMAGRSAAGATRFSTVDERLNEAARKLTKTLSRARSAP